jgi:hypothetical protein
MPALYLLSYTPGPHPKDEASIIARFSKKSITNEKSLVFGAVTKSIQNFGLC